MPQWHFNGDDTLPRFAFCAASLLDASAMLRGMRIAGLKARSLRTALIAGALGMAPLAASTAATPADGTLPLDANAAAEFVPEIVPVTEMALPEGADPSAELPASTPIGSGTASYYGRKFHGRRTASGEAFDMGAMTAAHRTLPFGSLVRVSNPANGKSVVVRINDRGPMPRSNSN
jgi:rare lipoprotein A